LRNSFTNIDGKSAGDKEYVIMDKTRKELIDKIKNAVAGVNDEKAVLATVVELLDGFSENYNWTGFYMKRGDILEVGPYIGTETSHTEIELNRGICGAAVTGKKTIMVDDVNTDPRHLACSLTTRSEIVVPLMDGNTCLGEIDIDSNNPSNFNHQDKEMLESIASIVVKRLKEIG